MLILVFRRMQYLEVHTDGPTIKSFVEVKFHLHQNGET